MAAYINGGIRKNHGYGVDTTLNILACAPSFYSTFFHSGGQAFFFFSALLSLGV